jgi:hypothetical protein
LFEAAKRSKDHARELLFDGPGTELRKEDSDSAGSFKKHKSGLSYPSSATHRNF